MSIVWRKQRPGGHIRVRGKYIVGTSPSVCKDYKAALLTVAAELRSGAITCKTDAVKRLRELRRGDVETAWFLTVAA